MPVLDAEVQAESQWFTGASQSQRAFRPVKRVWDDREQWAVGMIASFEKEASDPKFSQIKKRPTSLYSVTKENLEDRIEEIKDELADEVQQGLDQATGSRNGLVFDRSKGGHKIGTGFQSFLTTFADFLESYSGIVELVRGVDDQYGGLAYGTLSLLLSVSVHKKQREESMEEALEELSCAFPRLQVLQSIHPTTRLKDMIPTVYALIIDFARETTAYCRDHTWKRVRDALSPAKTKMANLSKIRRQLVEIRKESELLMQKQISDMQKDVLRLERSMKLMSLRQDATHVDVRIGQVQHDQDHLAKLRKVLDHARATKRLPYSTDTARYKETLRNAFVNQRTSTRYTTPCKIDGDLLESEQKFNDWLAGTKSHLLLLAGNNLPDSYTTLNWLSYASVFAVERLQSQCQHVAYVYCQTEYKTTDRLRATADEVMRLLIYQLANSHPDLLRNEHDTIAAALQACADEGEADNNWRSPDPAVAFDAMTALLTRLLNAFDTKKSITLVIDRPDACKEGQAEYFEGSSSADWIYTVTEGLLRVLADVKCTVKVLLVVDALPMQRCKPLLKALPRETKDIFSQRLDWQQETEEERLNTGRPRRNSNPH